MRLLFVEDNVAFRKTVLQEFLGGHEVTCAGSLLEARRQVATGSFDAVLLDYDLPDGKGEELIPDLLAAGLEGRIVATSAFGENNVRLLLAGASATVRKADFRSVGAILSRIQSLGNTTSADHP